jgi:MtrB/PioB family decaheme-associated outer membrane protein
MRTSPLLSPLALLAALGVLSATGVSAAEVDTSQWKCAKCPYTKGTTGTVDAGAGYVSDDSTTFGNYTGLQKKGPYLDLGGQVTHRGEDGYFADLSASDLGLDIRRLEGQAGREGLYTLKVGYAEIPRYFAEGAQTPFLGNGGNALTLPTGVGFPAGDTASMPLGSTLKPVELGYKARRFDLSGTWIGQENWTYRVSLRRDVRDGSKPTAGSFYNTASQLAAPVDQTTDQFEVAASYVTRQFQATLAYQISQFRNGNESLTWENPFNPVVTGATTGQLAQAPDNEFHQIVGSIGYQFTQQIRASADFAAGRGTQNASYLSSTLNPTLAVPSLPASSLDARTDTYNANVKVTYTPVENLRLNAIYAWDVRDAQTDILAYPYVATDMFVDPALRSNTPFDLTQNRFKLNGDYRGPDTWKFSAGADWDRRERNFQEVVKTDETTLWGRASVQALESVALSLNLAHADRNPSTYGTSYWFGAPQNPLMRKYNLAARTRNTGGARADWSVSESFTLGVGLDYAKDDYNETQIGLTDSETFNLALDLSYALSEGTRLHAFAQGERMKSNQAGSQTYGAPDWTGKVEDKFEVLGFGIKHAAIPDKLDLGADLSVSRARSDTSVQTAAGEPPFPTAKTSRDVFKLYASYKLNDSTWLNGSWWYESYTSDDWRLDGVQPATVYNLLAFGNQAPRYHQNVVRVSVRYQF